jgi:hypothetical protein
LIQYVLPQLHGIGRRTLLATIVRLTGDALKPLAIRLYIHEATGDGVSLDPIAIWALKLTAVVNASPSIPISGVSCHQRVPFLTLFRSCYVP